MGRKSSRQDKNEGMLDKAKGKAKEAAGAVSGDEAKKGEEHSSPNGQVSEKKAASPGASEV